MSIRIGRYDRRILELMTSPLIERCYKWPMRFFHAFKAVRAEKAFERRQAPQGAASARFGTLPHAPYGLMSPLPGLEKPPPEISVPWRLELPQFTGFATKPKIWRYCNPVIGKRTFALSRVCWVPLR